MNNYRGEDAQILAIISNDAYKNIIEVNFDNYLASRIMFVDSPDGIKKILSENKIKLILTMSEIDRKDTSLQVDKELSSSNISMPVIIIGEQDNLKKRYANKNNYTVSQPSDLKSILKTSASLLNLTIRDIANLPVPDYVAIKIDTFKYLSISPVDVFVKIGRGDKVNFIRIFATNDDVDKERIDRYISRGADSLYCKKEDRLKYTNEITSQIIIDIESDLKNNKSKVIETAVKIIYDRIIEEGPSKEMAGLSSRVLKEIVKKTSSQSKVYPLLQILLKNKSSFQYKFIQLTSFFSAIILKSMDWKRKEQIETLAFVSMFRDISIVHREDFLRIRSDDDMNRLNLNEVEADLIKRHPQESIRIVDGFSSMPYGADTIIRQHHGSTNGSGFPDHYSARLSPLSVIMMVAEECAFVTIESVEPTEDGEELEIDRRLILNAVKKKFSSQKFHRIITALEKSF